MSQTATLTATCPTNADDSDLVGCGHTFEADLEQGWADCPRCGLAFKPATEAALPAKQEA